MRGRADYEPGPFTLGDLYKELAFDEAHTFERGAPTQIENSGIPEANRVDFFLGLFGGSGNVLRETKASLLSAGLNYFHHARFDLKFIQQLTEAQQSPNVAEIMRNLDWYFFGWSYLGLMLKPTSGKAIAVVPMKGSIINEAVKFSRKLDQTRVFQCVIAVRGH